MTITLAKHGTEKGYKQELKTRNVCTRCQNAHREYNRQFTKAYKIKGIKYTNTMVLDVPSVGANRRDTGPRPGRFGVDRVSDQTASSPGPQEPTESDAPGPGRPGLAESLGSALRDRIGAMRVPGDPEANDYVPDPEIPNYLHEVDPDPEPDGEWAVVDESDPEFVINAQAMAKIEENLGFYLGVVGMTVEMVDPYCGPALAANFDNIVKRWSKLIGHYPKAAEFFLSEQSGVLFAWIGAIQATWPVLFAIYQHHLSKEIRTHDGIIERKIKDNEGTHYVNDATTPPMPQFDFSVR
jgi:hypothetical protein